MSAARISRESLAESQMYQHCIVANELKSTEFGTLPREVEFQSIDAEARVSISVAVIGKCICRKEFRRGVWIIFDVRLHVGREVDVNILLVDPYLNRGMMLPLWLVRKSMIWNIPYALAD